MVSPSQAAPSFGAADLSNCEREQIHLAGSIQPFGVFLLVREDDLQVVQASANAERFLGLDAPVIGTALAALPGNLAQRLRPHLDDRLTQRPVAIRCRVGRPASAFDGLVHRPRGGGVVVELERGGPDLDLTPHLQRALDTIVTASSLSMLCDQAADLVRELTGYDRVMVYRFDEEGHGEVFAERKAAGLEAFLGNRYPASDIPQMARRLYERNRIRILADVAYDPVPLLPRRSPLSGDDLDMSMCFLRSMSPLHIQYLKNMGVGATLVVSLMVGGRLWGLISCHHYAPRLVHFDVRAVCELLAEALGTRIAALDAFAEAEAETAVRRLEQRMVNAISQAGDWRAALFDGSQALLAPLDAQGAALLLDGEVATAGDVPGTQQIRAVGAWLAARPRLPVTVTTSLRSDAPDLHHLMPDIGGLLAAPIADLPGDYLVWFRPERIRTVTWGGNPTKPFTVGNDPRDLSPRRSFAQWHELVDGTCEAWSPAQRRTGRLIGETVADVVLQFRSVRMLIAQDQLNSIGRQVQASAQPVLLADARGRTLLTNGAFDLLLAGRPAPSDVGEIASLFAEPSAAERSLKDLTLHRRPWRGEIVFDAAPGGPVPLLVRGDPVLSAPGRVLGFVLLFMDMSERQAAVAARRRFQDSLGPAQTSGTRLPAAVSAPYDTLLSTMIENAQVAALEITDGLDMARIPETLDAVRTSVGRATEVLERLMRHAARPANDEA